MIKLRKDEAKNFMLYRQGLLGEKIFAGKTGLLDFIHKVGSVQFDPVDVCGTSPELVFQARIQDFTKKMLDELLYTDRQLIDFFDKNLCILPVDNWPMFREKYAGVSYAEFMAQRQDPAIERMMSYVRAYLADKPYVFARDLRHLEQENLVWDWGASSSVARAALENMYFKTELMIHHKKGRQKAYALAENHLPEHILKAENPFENEAHYHEALLLRRIGAVGLLWNKPSDAWLGIKNFKVTQRNQAFQSLLDKGKITPVQIEGLKETFYMKTAEKSLLTDLSALTEPSERVEFLAPLDNLLWDRNIIRAIFDFDYKWEIYTPKEKRKYGAYVLPVLYQNRFIGRVEIERKTKEKVLLLKNFWLEENERFSSELEKAFLDCVESFKKFNLCEKIHYEENWKK